MTSPLLESLSLAISLAANDARIVEHFPAWRDYAWVEVEATACRGSTVEACVDLTGRWDWKRDQTFRFTAIYELNEQAVRIGLQLANGDLEDADQVCVTALFIDGDWRLLLAFHESWFVVPGRTMSRAYLVSPSVHWPDLQRVIVGSKQCRDGPLEDRKPFLDAIAETGQGRLEDADGEVW